MRASAGLLVVILLTLVLLVIIFASTKFILPNPETVEENRKIEQNAQDSINELQKKSKDAQTQEVDN